MKPRLGNWQAIFSATALAVATANATDLVWIGGTGNWNSAGNWSPVQVPLAADNAWITNGGTYTVTVPAGTTATAASVTVGGPGGTQTLAIDRATLTLSEASVINSNGQLDLLVSQSVVTGAGNLTVSGTLNWANGTISGTGAMSVVSGGMLAIGSGGVTLARTLNNSGSVTWDGGNLTFSTGATINNLASGTIDITADGHLNGAATTPINNSGLFRQTAGTVNTIITAPFNNSGDLRVLAATLSLNLGGTHTGTFSNAPGTTVNFSGGSHVLDAGSVITGEGSLSLSGNATTLTASGTFDAGTTVSVTAGAATLSAGCNVTGTTFGIGGGTLNFNSAGPVFAVNLTAGTLGGTSPMNVTGPLTLSGGTVTNALVTAIGGLTINGNTTLNGTTLINPGTAFWSAGNFTGANGAVFSNLLGATFINTFDGNAASGAGATPLFVNAGLFQKTDGTAALGTTSVDFRFINTGTMEVQTNTLRYGINQQTAGLTLLDGGNLSAQTEPIQLLGGSLVGTGLVTVANLQNIINSAAISPGLPLGRLDVAGNYQQTASGILNIELGGYLPGTNFDLVTVTAGGAGGVAVLGGTLNVTLTNGFAPTNGATFTFLIADSRVGAFATFNYPSNDVGMQLSVDPTSATLKVTNLKPVVANPIADPAPITYGTAFNFQFPADTFEDPDGDPLTYTASGMPPGITFAVPTRTFSGTPTEAGVFPVRVIANDGGLANLTATNTFNITINPATLSVAAQTQTKTYGGSDPALSYTIDGLQFADTSASVLVGALARAAGESVTGSPYAITLGTLTANGNYTLSFTGSTLAITPAPLSITTDAKSKTYGAAEPPFTASYAGFVNGETSAVLGGTLTFARAPGENVGGYLITPGGLTSTNYAIGVNTGILTIIEAPLSVTADARTKIYGALDPALTYTVSGLQFADTSAGVLAGALARAAGESVAGSPYTITQGTLTANGNYTVSFTGSTLAITPAPLSVTADAKSKTYSGADPVFTATYTGFVNNETPAVLGGELAFTRVPGENVGSYIVTPGGLTNGNYAITFNIGTLTITAPAPVILSLVTTTTNVVITWSAVSNATYRVQYETVLDATNWTDLIGDVLASDSTASKIDTKTTTNRFYRLKVQTP
jgi:acyl CoA:acetate/3-ketoacid CoA transferase alpha subunit